MKTSSFSPIKIFYSGTFFNFFLFNFIQKLDTRKFNKPGSKVSIIWWTDFLQVVFLKKLYSKINNLTRAYISSKLPIEWHSIYNIFLSTVRESPLPGLIGSAGFTNHRTPIAPVSILEWDIIQNSTFKIVLSNTVKLLFHNCNSIFNFYDPYFRYM